MAYRFKSTGDSKTDATIREIECVLSWLKNEIDKKADKTLLNSLLSELELHDEITNFRYWRRREVDHYLIWEYDASFGTGAPNWVEYHKWDPES